MHSSIGYENGLESITDKGSLDPVPSKNNVRVRENGTYDLRTQFPHSTLPLYTYIRGFDDGEMFSDHRSNEA